MANALSWAAALHQLCGDVGRTRARGDAGPDADYDAVFLKDFGGFGREAARIAAIETDILYETGTVINALPFRAGAYDDRTGLMHELRREGRGLVKPKVGKAFLRMPTRGFASA